MEMTTQQLLNLEAELVRSDLSMMVRKSLQTVDPAAEYSHNWHIDLICDYLLAVTNLEIKRLIINVPPRTLKSVCVNVAWPAFLLGHDPTERILSGSVATRLANKMSMDTRTVMQSAWFQRAFPECQLAKDQNEKTEFKTTKQGLRRAVSVGSKVIGEGGNRLIVDDPHDPEGAESDAQRITALDWYDTAFSTRMNDPKKATMVIIMQRLHTEDLTGHLMEKGGYEQLIIPAEAEEKTIIDFGRFKENPIVREVGDMLHPDRMPEWYIQERKTTLGSYGYAGQFQQTPQPKGGGMLKVEWIKHHKGATGEGMNIAILGDKAGAKVSANNPDPDYTAFMVVGLGADRNYYILDIVRDRLNLTERWKTLLGLHKRWTVNDVPPQFVGYEKIGADSDIEFFNNEMMRENYNFHIEPMNASKPLQKEVRIEKLVPLFEARRVYLPSYGFIKTDTEGFPRDLVKSFVEEEYKPFPVAKHDDMLDTLAQICDPHFYVPFPRFREDAHKDEEYDFDGDGGGGGSFMSV